VGSTGAAGATVATVAALCAVVAALAVAAPSSAPARSGADFDVAVGDIVSVAGTNVRCKVTRRHRASTLECIRLDRGASTYGVFMSGRRVQVFRFDRRKVGHTVFSAVQGSSRMETCGRRC
jgi:hypothetical protein